MLSSSASAPRIHSWIDVNRVTWSTNSCASGSRGIWYVMNRKATGAITSAMENVPNNQGPVTMFISACDPHLVDARDLRLHGLGERGGLLWLSGSHIQREFLTNGKEPCVHLTGDRTR